MVWLHAGVRSDAAARNAADETDLRPHTGIRALAPLEGCKSLTSLDVTKSKVTAAGVATLQKSLPNCKIEWTVRGRESGVGVGKSQNK